MVRSKGKIWLIAGILVLVILAILAIALLVLRSPEDSWIKDEKGVYVEHGNPAGIPIDVAAQQTALNCAYTLYESEKQSGKQLSSQCIGTCGDYAVDIVHDPRTEEDNLAENQCSDYRVGEVKHFIEMDKDGNIVRIG
jgi:hypothetical protein